MPLTPPRGRSRIPATAIALGAATLAVAAAAAPPAAAAESATSKSGGRLTVSKTQALNPAGETVTVSGTGFGRVRAGGHNGIYVSLCQSQGAGKLATPCVGGVDMEGASGSSLWIGDKVPPYGAGLAKPFNKGPGAFEYQLTLKAKDEFVDCTKVSCVVQVRADHTSSGDRADDAVVPVTWSTGSGSSAGGASTGTTSTGNSSASNGSTSSTTTNGSGTSTDGSASSASSAASSSSATGQTTDGSSASGGSAAGGGDAGGGAAGGASGATAAEALPKTGGTERTVALAFGATALVAAGTAAVLAAFRRRNTPAAPTT